MAPLKASNRPNISWRNGLNYGYLTSTGPRPKTSSLESQLILVTKKGINAQGSDADSSTQAFLYTHGSLEVLTTTLTSHWHHTWDKGRQSQTFTTHQGSTFTARNGDVFLGAEGNVFVLSGKIIAGDKALFYSGQQHVALESASQTISNSYYSENYRGPLNGTCITHKEDVHSVPQPTEVSAQGGVTSFAAMSNILSGTIIKSPKLRLISPQNLIKAVPVYKASVSYHHDSDFHLTKSTEHEETHKTHCYSVLPMQTTIENPVQDQAPNVSIDIPATGLLDWQEKYFQDLKAMKQQLSHSEDALSESDLNALAAIPNVIQNVLHEKHEVKHKVTRTMGPGLTMTVSAIITAVTAGSSAIANLGTVAQSASGSAFVAGMTKGAATAIASNLATRTLHHLGDLEKGLKDTFDQEGLKAIATQALSQGLIEGLQSKFYTVDEHSVNALGKQVTKKVIKLPKVGLTAEHLGHVAMKKAVRSTVQCVVNGQSWDEALKSFSVDTALEFFETSASKAIGDPTIGEVLSKQEAQQRGLKLEDLCQVGDHHYRVSSLADVVIKQVLHFGKGACHGLALKGDPLITGLAAAGAETVCEIAEHYDVLPDRNSEWFRPTTGVIAELIAIALGAVYNSNQQTLDAAKDTAKSAVEHNFNEDHLSSLLEENAQSIYLLEKECERLQDALQSATTPEEKESLEKQLETTLVNLEKNRGISRDLIKSFKKGAKGFKPRVVRDVYDDLYEELQSKVDNQLDDTPYQEATKYLKDFVIASYEARARLEAYNERLEAADHVITPETFDTVLADCRLALLSHCLDRVIIVDDILNQATGGVWHSVAEEYEKFMFMASKGVEGGVKFVTDDQRVAQNAGEAFLTMPNLNFLTGRFITIFKDLSQIAKAGKAGDVAQVRKVADVVKAGQVEDLAKAVKAVKAVKAGDVAQAGKAAKDVGHGRPKAGGGPSSGPTAPAPDVGHRLPKAGGGPSGGGPSGQASVQALQLGVGDLEITKRQSMLHGQSMAEFDKQLAEYIQKMQKPYVKEEQLAKLANDLYRDNAKIGSGSTADALRFEKNTGNKVGGAMHEQKCQNYLCSIEKWLKINTNNPKISCHDKQIAKNIVRDLEDALN